MHYLSKHLKRFKPHVFEHFTFRRKVWDFILVKEYRLYKRIEFLKSYREHLRTRFWHSLFDFFKPMDNLPYEVWDIAPYLRALSYRLWEKRYYGRLERNRKRLRKMPNPYKKI